MLNRMDTYQFDVALICAGIAGSTAATALAPDCHSR
jgi:flavin-dependent dehydrogenase